jgi:hypothetical protein
VGPTADRAPPVAPSPVDSFRTDGGTSTCPPVWGRLRRPLGRKRERQHPGGPVRHHVAAELALRPDRSPPPVLEVLPRSLGRILWLVLVLRLVLVSSIPHPRRHRSHERHRFARSRPPAQPYELCPSIKSRGRGAVLGAVGGITYAHEAPPELALRRSHPRRGSVVVSAAARSRTPHVKTRSGLSPRPRRRSRPFRTISAVSARISADGCPGGTYASVHAQHRPTSHR